MSEANGKTHRRVEYLARVRYSNQLPPPPFAPRPVKYEVPKAELVNAGSLSAVFLQRGVSPETDVELGMPLDLSLFDQAFDFETAESVMCPPETEVDPEDAVLLGEPQPSATGAGASRSFAQSAGVAGGSAPSSAGSTAKSSSEIGMGTAFLRRTAYMSGDTRRSSKRKSGSAGLETAANTFQSRVEAEIEQIEQSFEAVKAPLPTLKHPSKRGLKAVSAKPLFPDSKESDQGFAEVKMLGSAALETLPRKFSPSELQSSVFYKSNIDIGAGQKYEWMSFLAAQSEEAEKLSKLRGELRDTLPADEAQAEEQAVFPLDKAQDSEFSILPYKQRFEETVVTQGESAYFCVPVSARYTLRRRRVPQHLQQQARDAEFDVLDLGLRELTPEESIQRDEVRSIYDPVNYG